MEELTAFLTAFKFVIDEKVIKDDFKLLKLKNNYSFYNEVSRDIHVVITPALTEENYEVMHEKLRDLKFLYVKKRTPLSWH